MEPITPAYDGASVAGIIPALFGRGDAEWLPSVARAADSVVLLVLDGLGWTALQEHVARTPTLTAMEGGPITTVVPSTTSTALTSITTGLAPAQHGVVGYRMLVPVPDEGATVLNVLRWTSVDGARVPDPFDVQRHPPFLGREVPVVSRSEFRESGFSRAHLRGARFVGWHTTAVLVEHCARLVAAGERFVYAYYPGIDTVAHEFGLHDSYFARELASTDTLVAELLDALPARTTLLVTADHGQVHLEPQAWLQLPLLGDALEHVAGDARFRYLYTARGRAKEVLDIVRDAVGKQAWVLSRREVLEAGWLGEGPSGTIPGRLGDVVIAARDDVAFVDPALPKEATLRSGHGSLTPDEMLVPLVAAPGRAG